ncbi:MAG TPA: Do family serine endopeptidase [Myxococcales bacterium]|nr:Do family serine endopeptidase [Myxococcales bacterium]
MRRSRITLLCAFALGSLVTLVALPIAFSSRGSQRDLAGEAQAAPVASPAAALAEPPAVPASSGQLTPLPSLAPLVKQLRPVVVNINSRFKPRRATAQQRRSLPQARPRQPFDQGPGEEGDDDQQDPMERFFRFFGGQPMPDEGERHGLGSGFLIGNGMVLTNNHVVQVQDPGSNKFRPMDDIKVITDETSPVGAREYVGKVIGNDPKSDIALLKLEGEHVNELKGAMLGDSDALQVGDYVVAIGEPFGLQATVTAGIISAKERALGPGSVYSDFLQTDASINPGNSGGPLFNLRGEVIGVNTAIIGGANTIGFAIPIAVVKQILPQLEKNGRVARGFLGVQPQPITQDMVDNLGLKGTQGALMADVVKGSPADKSGIKPGDVVVALNGKPINDANQLTRDVGSIPPNQTVRLDVVRDGKSQRVEVKLAERPDEQETTGRASGSGGDVDRSSGDILGVRVQDLTPELAQRARVEPGTKGVVITDLAQDSPASNAGLDPGDVILEINRQPVASVADYKKLVSKLKKGDTALLRVRSGQAVQYLPVKLR